MPTLWGETDITVAGQNQSDVLVVLRPGMRVSGSIVFEAKSQTPLPDLKTVRVPMIASQPAGLTSSVSAATVNPDGTFIFASVAPGDYYLRPVLPRLPASNNPVWTLKSAMVNGRDVADAPLEIRANEDITGVVVTFTDQWTGISGTLFDAAGRPTPEFSIVVFSTNRTFWKPSSTAHSRDASRQQRYIQNLRLACRRVPSSRRSPTMTRTSFTIRLSSS